MAITSVRTVRSVLTRPWVGPLAVMTVGFIAFSVPPYLGLDPAQARVVLPEDVPFYYPLLVTHIVFGSVALLAACVQVWPWLRQHHPGVHRLGGRVYVAAGALPAGVAVLVISPLGHWGANQQVANTLLALLWLATTVAGYRAARRRCFDAHRRWMIRSVALAFSIVANRLWLIACVLVFAPEGFTAGGVMDPAATGLAEAIGVSSWLSWVVNLLAAEWWLNRRR